MNQANQGEALRPVTRVSARALTLFTEALAFPDTEREAWLQKQTAGDVSLRVQLAALDAADRQARLAMPSEGLGLARIEAPPPERVGAYRIVDQLGAGGMGAVYLARRDDGLFDHEVAVKVMRASLTPDAARALFDRERRFLAKLSHKNIAQLFDGGVTPEGAPYFVLERVQGISIDVYCSHAKLDAPAIARLFLDVCAGVAHAHQRLIVHGDMKPANVLVDASGAVKVLDFGVARTLAEADDEGGIYPRTPAYASPARLDGQAPVVTDDVFALGMMLGQLLGSDAERGDLQRIVQKASAPLETDRYQSVMGFADDLERWLALRPLAHRGDEPIYVLAKFVRRRRWAVGAASIALAALISALAVTVQAYVAADNARALAETRFRDVRGLANYLLFDVYEAMASKPNSLALRSQIAERAQAYLERLAEDEAANMAVRREVVEGLFRLAEIQASPRQSNLGQIAQAARNLARAEEIAAVLAEAAPQDRSLAWVRVRIALARATLAMSADQDLAAAAAFIASAEAALGGQRQVDAAEEGELSVAILVERSLLAQWRGDYGEAVRAARAALDMAQAATAMARARLEHAALDERAIDSLAEALYYAGDRDGAEREYRRLVELVTDRAAAAPADMEMLRRLARARWALGTTLLDTPKAREAMTHLADGLNGSRRLVAFEPMDEGARRIERLNLAAYAQALAANGARAEAIALMRAHVGDRAALREARATDASVVRDYAIGLGMLADMYADDGNAGAACPLYEAALTIFGDLSARGTLSALDAANAVARDRTRHANLCAVDR